MTTQITSGPAEVLDNGEVTTFGGHGLTLAFEWESHPVIVELTFGSDPDVDGAAVTSEQRSDGWHLHCVNFDPVDGRDQGRGSSVPILLSGFEKDAFYLHFRVFLWGRTRDRTVHYTFYRVPGAIVETGDAE